MDDTGVIELTSEKLIAGGDALARHPDGRAVLLQGALPGERVRAGIQDEKRDYLRAATLEVLDPADERRLPPCEALARGCGGCDWLHIEPRAQLGFKAAIVTEALRRTARIDGIDVRPGGSVPDTAYRTTLRVALDESGRPAFRAAGSQRLVSVDHCLVAHPALNGLLAELALPGAREAVLRTGARTGERSVRWWPDTLPRPASLPTDVRSGPHAFVHEIVAGVRLRVSADAFFQSSPEAADLLVDAVRRAAGPAESWGTGPVLDAYGGVGLFAATLLAADRERLVVESNGVACEDARLNLAGLPARVIERALERWTPKRMGLVIANPARAGLGRGAVAVLAATRTPILVLVSCDPVAFARDARLLGEQGYRLESCEALDPFPQTHHVEVVSRFVHHG